MISQRVATTSNAPQHIGLTWSQSQCLYIWVTAWNVVRIIPWMALQNYLKSWCPCNIRVLSSTIQLYLFMHFAKQNFLTWLWLAESRKSLALVLRGSFSCSVHFAWDQYCFYFSVFCASFEEEFHWNVRHRITLYVTHSTSRLLPYIPPLLPFIFTKKTTFQNKRVQSS